MTSKLSGMALYVQYLDRNDVSGNALLRTAIHVFNGPLAAVKKGVTAKRAEYLENHRVISFDIVGGNKQFDTITETQVTE